MTSSNFIFSRHYLNTVGGFSDYRYVLDYDWLLRGLISGRKLGWLNAPLLRYRWHETNTISEHPMAANVECATMLRQHFPTLLASNVDQRLRLDHLASQWARIDRYVGEIGATLRHETAVAVEDRLFPEINDRDKWIAERDEWIAERDEVIFRQRQWIQDRDCWIAERDELIRGRDMALAECHEAIQRIMDSKSFVLGRAITSPWRFLKKIIFGVRS